MLRPSRLLPAFVLVGMVCIVHAQSTKAENRMPGPQPYTAEFKNSRVQTLANGTTITYEYTQIEARDSAGRNLTSTTVEKPHNGDGPITQVLVQDQAANRITSWDSRSKGVRTVQGPTQDEKHGCWATDYGDYHSYGPPAGQPAPVPKRSPTAEANAPVHPVHHDRPQEEDLGTIKILGVEAKGRRITKTIPVGEIGNDQTIVIVNEIWSAPSLGLVLRQSSDDPRTGKQSREVVSLTLDEPDPALFRPPDGYDSITDTQHQVPCRQ